MDKQTRIKVERAIEMLNPNPSFNPANELERAQALMISYRLLEDHLEQDPNMPQRVVFPSTVKGEEVERVSNVLLRTKLDFNVDGKGN